MNFDKLINLIATTQQHLQQKALQTVNQFLTVRNWIIGYYIVEYEQKGEDRAQYGENLLEFLAAGLKSKGLKGFAISNLRSFRQFYQMYPQIHQTVSGEFKNKILLLPDSIRQSVPDKLQISEQQIEMNPYSPKAELLLTHFTFSHFVELIKIDNSLKRAFYEIEGIKGNWSVRQLKRQIESLLYERTGLSKKKSALVEKVHAQGKISNIEDTIRDPYILEFTGLQEKPEYSENDLETALRNHIQEFLLELGNGFCFEARQKRITIDNEHDRIDLVFYHRILHCHVLLDLKIRAFSHADVGQMNFYLNYFKENVMTDNDNPPVGLILCTDKNETKVKYAITGIDNQLFVSKYLVSLPSEKDLEKFIIEDKERIEADLSKNVKLNSRYIDKNSTEYWED